MRRPAGISLLRLPGTLLKRQASGATAISDDSASCSSARTKMHRFHRDARSSIDELTAPTWSVQVVPLWTNRPSFSWVMADTKARLRQMASVPMTEPPKRKRTCLRRTGRFFIKSLAATVTVPSVLLDSTEQNRIPISFSTLGCPKWDCSRF
jgi:hypothetical protein